MSMTLHFPVQLFSEKMDNTDGLNQLQMDAFGCIVQGSFLTHMYWVVQAVTIVEAAAAEPERESLMQCILHDWIIY